MEMTIQEQQQTLAVDTAERIKKYLSRTWTEDGQATDAVAETSAKVADAIKDWLLALHGPTAIATKAVATAKKAIKTHCYEDEASSVADMYNEAIMHINDLHNNATAKQEAKQAKQAENDRLRSEREAKKIADKKIKIADKAKKNELAARKKLEASQDWDAIIAWRPEGRELVSLRTMQANLLTGDTRNYHVHYPDLDEAYRITDMSAKSLYLLSHYDSVGTPILWEMAISQFDEASSIATNKAGAQTIYRFYVG